MKTIYNFISLLSIILILFSCSKKEHNISHTKNYQNSSTYPQIQKDSAQAIQSITKQKLQQVLDLSVLYSQNGKDKEIDTALYNQILGYFYEPDSLTLQPLLQELDSLGVEKATIQSIENRTLQVKKDTLNFVKFKLNYLNENEKKIDEVEHEMQYILLSAPIKFKKEFKFYFLNYFPQPINDSTRLGVTK